MLAFSRAFSSGWSSRNPFQQVHVLEDQTANIRALQAARGDAKQRPTGDWCCTQSEFGDTGMFPPSFHQCRGQRATELIRPFTNSCVDGAVRLRARRPALFRSEPGGHLVYRIGCAHGVVIAMHPQAIWPAGPRDPGSGSRRCRRNVHVPAANIGRDAVKLPPSQIARKVRRRTCSSGVHQILAEVRTVNALQASSAGSLAMTG